jgi:hypothetical protein
MGPSRPATVQRGHPTMRLGRYTSSSILCLTVLAFFPLEGKGQGVDLGEDAAGALFPFVGTGKSTSLNTQESPQARFDWARTAWDLGRYVEALEELERLLVEGRAPELVPAIALLTGELYAVAELAVDGRAVRWAPDGLLAAYEVGTGAAAATRILELGQGGPREVASVPGTGLVSAPGGGAAAYLAVTDSDEVRQARERLQQEMAVADRAHRMRLMGELSQLEVRNTDVVMRDLATGQERRVRPSGVLPSSLLYGPDGALYLLGAREAGEGLPAEPRSDVFRLRNDGRTEAVTEGPGIKTDPFFAGGGAFLVYGAGREAFALQEMASGSVRTFQGSFPVLSADGATLGFLGGDASGPVLTVISLQGGRMGPPRTVGIPFPVPMGSSRSCPSCPLLSGLALAPGGEMAVIQAMPREDWELFLVDLSGGAPGLAGRELSGSEVGAGAPMGPWAGAGVPGSELVQLTREIQHDLYPMVLGDGGGGGAAGRPGATRILAMKGEARHRRSHLYDLGTGGITWLFRNNTVRTVAPEYEWAPSPDGTKLLIVADRDGNTISPERGVYLMDLTREVTREEVLARVRTNLAAERALRATAESMYGPMEAEIREVVGSVSRTHLFDYQEALFRFGSKYITQPGNRQAIHYLVETLRGFGYEPELQWFEARGAETANVIARLPGTVSPDVVYAVSAHFDSNLRSPGADDNTSGTVGLVEMARILAGRPMPATIEIALFTGEEAGLLGSREYVRRAVESGKNLVGALNNDMVGFAEDHRLDNTIRYSNSGIRDLQHGAAIIFSELVTYDAEYYRSTDAAAYYEAYGDVVGGIGSYPILASPHYHQSHDVLETVNHQLVAEVTKVTTASIMLLASSPSRIKGLEVMPRPGAEGAEGMTAGGYGVVEVTWNPSPERDVVEYRVASGPPEDPWRSVVTVQEPRVMLEGVRPGDVVSVNAVNRRGFQGWDWARVNLP